MDVCTHEPAICQKEESHEIDGGEQCQSHDRDGPNQSASGDRKEVEHRS
jgi:hypothetical protein